MALQQVWSQLEYFGYRRHLSGLFVLMDGNRLLALQPVVSPFGLVRARITRLSTAEGYGPFVKEEMVG